VFRASFGIAASLVIAACQPGPTSAPTPADSPSATGVFLASSPVPATWNPVELPEAIGQWRVGGVIADPDGFVVFGSVNQLPLAWSSPDGRAWDAVVLQGGKGFPSRAATSDDATVLLGAGGTERCAHPFGEFLWRRLHGDRNWVPVPFDELFCAGGFPSIAASEDLFVVAGMGTGDQPFAWRSDDGLRWFDAAAGLPFDLPPWALAATGGEFLELGRGQQTDARVTVDGTSWTSVPAPPAPPAFNAEPPGMDPAALLDTDGGLLAVYQAGDASRIAAWRRDEAGSWLEVPMPTRPGDIISGGAFVDGRLFLFGTRAGVAYLLTSSDLATWAEVQVPEVGAILGLASAGKRTVLVTVMTDPDGDFLRSIVFETNGLPGAP
jgi:hypothetical protein